MKQVVQHLKTGKLEIVDVPRPVVRPEGILVRSIATLISAGTERMVIEFAGKSLLGKARSRPDLVAQALDKTRRDGLLATYEAVRNRLDQPMALGYSSAGTVITVGERLSDFKVGDRVACAGGGYAVHAEVVSVPKNLVVKLPDNVDFESAAFTTLGAIALHGLRLAELRLGENVAIIGLGLLGQLTIQLVKAAGCQVVAVDLLPNRVSLARELGVNLAVLRPDAEAAVMELSQGYGVDVVIITADTKNNDPVELAGAIARDRGRVVAVGDVGMSIPRRVYYNKELDFRISRSYGPGRYDLEYEEKGHDYPIGYVRWTENRNMQAFLRLLAEGKVDVKPLITHRFPIEEAPKAYDLITGKTGESFLGILITYPEQPDLSPLIQLRSTFHVARSNAPTFQRATVGLLGAGNFATATLLPSMKKVPGIQFVGVCTATGVSARHAGDRFGFRYCTTNENEILNDPDVNTVVIATRHHLHARQVIAALNAGKHVFCEKPLCLNEGELAEIVQVYDALTADGRPRTAEAIAAISSRRSVVVMVGYNRRFAPMARQLKAFLADAHEPLVMHYRVNAGYIPPDHWVHDPDQGGGRIIGEVCHFVDFLTFLVGTLPVRVHTRALPNDGRYRDDNLVITVEFADDSLGTITYVANGDKAFPKERVEVFGGGRVAVLDDFRRLDSVRNGRKKVYKSRLRQDKGHRGEWEAFVAALRDGGPPPIPFEKIVATMLTTFRILDSLRCGEPVAADTAGFLASALAAAPSDVRPRNQTTD